MLRIPRDVLEGIYAHAREGRPQEVCGLLAGRSSTDVHTVVSAFRVRNASDRSIVEYVLDPEEHLRATIRVEDELGLEVVGFYHSHPAGPPRLSATDAARATWPGASYLLIHLAPTVGHMSARWDADSARFVDEPVEVT